MSGEISALFISLGMKTDALSKGIQSAQSSISGFLGSVTSMIAPLTGALALGSLFGKWSREADALGKFADRLGVDIKTMDAWSQAAQLSGSSAGEFQGTLDGLNRSLQEIAEIGTGRAKKAFDELGIKVKDNSGKTKSAIAILEELAGAASGMDKSKFVGLAKKAGIDTGTIMLLQTGKKSVRELVDEMKQFALTKDDQEAAEKFNDSIHVLGKSLLALASTFFRYVTPAITIFSDKLRSIFGYLNKHKAAVILFFGLLSTVIAAKLTPAVLAMGKAWLMNPLTWIIGILVILALILEDLWVYVNGGESALSGLWEKFDNGDGPIMGLMQTFGLFAVYCTIAIGVLMNLKSSLGGVGIAFNVLDKIFKKTVIGAIIAIIVLAIMLLIQNWDTVVAAFDSGIKKITTWFNGIKKTISEFADEVKNALPDWMKETLGIKVDADVQASSSVSGQVLAQNGEGGAKTINNDTAVTMNGININLPGGDPAIIAAGLNSAARDAFARDSGINAAMSYSGP